jgi:hypothetical protein
MRSISHEIQCLTLKEAQEFSPLLQQEGHQADGFMSLGCEK